ncbi:unnamed protein product [Calicophoron daubneyi]|uniref:pseudouridine 5'-phosphatase n=1 Tax=Calicophoron daubneyi TaxID=300641 RepID=A0AAV2T439_CALDB
MLLKCTHAIFDVDGLLLNTEEIYTAEMSKVFASFGMEFTYDIKRKLMGRKGQEAANVVINDVHLPCTVEEYTNAVSARLTPELWHGAKCLPGVERLIFHLAENNIPMALATGSRSEDLQQKMKAHQNIMDKMSHVVTSGDDPAVKSGKPAPDIFQIAASRFTNPPSNPGTVIVFEDSPLGVQAGVAAGMHVIWVPQPQEPPGDVPDTMSASSASHVTRIPTLLEFKPEMFGIPPFKTT